MAGISEDKATSVAYGGQQGRRAGSHHHEMKMGGDCSPGWGVGTTCCRDPNGQGRVWGAGRSPVPHLCIPLNISVGVALPITNPVPLAILGYAEPPKSTACSPVGRSPGAGSAALTPSPSWKAASGLSVRFLRFKPDFPDGWRAMRRSSDMPQGHTGPGRRRISSSEGWLGAPFPARWRLRTPFLGTKAVLWNHHHCPQAGRQLPWHPEGDACMDAAPQQPHCRSLLPGMAQVGMCLAGQRLSKHMGAQVGALRGTEMEQERK